jgi:hypothetical protein
MLLCWVLFARSCVLITLAFSKQSLATTPTTRMLLLVPVLTHGIPTVSPSKISRAEDDALDQPVPKQAAKMAGLSVRNGPLEDAMDIDEPATNGASKRKSRTSISKVNYKDDESSDDAAPLVRIHDTGKPFLWGQVC